MLARIEAQKKRQFKVNVKRALAPRAGALVESKTRTIDAAPIATSLVPATLHAKEHVHRHSSGDSAAARGTQTYVRPEMAHPTMASRPASLAERASARLPRLVGPNVKHIDVTASGNGPLTNDQR